MIPGDARFCRPEAIADLERHLPTLDQTDSLVAGAVAIVRHEYPDVCELEVREQTLVQDAEMPPEFRDVFLEEYGEAVTRETQSE